MRRDWNHITVDGVLGNEVGQTNRMAQNINLDAVSEVRVLLNTFRAEYGRTGGAHRRTDSCSAGALGGSEQGVDLLGCTDVVCQFDPGGPVTTEGGPQAEHHSTGLVERDLVVRLLGAAPAERLVEGARACQVPDSERHHTDALFHAPNYGAASR